MSAGLLEGDDFQPDTFVEPREPRKCTRHRWVRHSVTLAGVASEWTACANRDCGKVKDEALSRRGKQSRNYGNRAELHASRKYGGDKIGAAGGPVDIRGKDFDTQVKTHRRLPPLEWRTVFAKMAAGNRCPRLLLRFVQGPGVAPADYFVFPADDFLAWFGRDENLVEGDPYTVELASKVKP